MPRNKRKFSFGQFETGVRVKLTPQAEKNGVHGVCNVDGSCCGTVLGRSEEAEGVLRIQFDGHRDCVNVNFGWLEIVNPSPMPAPQSEHIV